MVHPNAQAKATVDAKELCSNLAVIARAAEAAILAVLFRLIHPGVSWPFE